MACLLFPLFFCCSEIWSGYKKQCQPCTVGSVTLCAAWAEAKLAREYGRFPGVLDTAAAYTYGCGTVQLSTQ